MKINYGCGRQVWDGYFNIDAVRSPKAPRAPELLHVVTFNPDGSIASPIPLPDGCADELHAYHVIEHVYAWEALALLCEWQRLLRDGGQLVLELPNLEAACRNVLAGKSEQMTMWPLYGDPGHKDTYMCHRWAYTPATITALLQEAGMRKIRTMPPLTHGRRADRDMRVECIK